MSSFADLERTIQGNADALNILIGKFGELSAESDKAKRTTKDLTSLEKQLGIALIENGKYYNAAKVRVSKYGEELNAVGDRTGNFNKRTSIMAQTIKKFTQNGKTTPFLKGLGVYLDQGGNSLEYFAEYLTSGREELTVFGFEAAKVRKVVYGFFPPGMFKKFNQLSSSLQFFGGMWRKLGDNTIGAKAELDKYKKALAGMNEADEGFNEISEIIKELEGDGGGWVQSILGGFKKLSNVMTKPIRAKGTFDEIKKEYDTTIEGKLFGDGLLKGMFKVATFKGQVKKRVKESGKQFQDEIGRYKTKLGKNFGLNLTPDKKAELKRLKKNIKTLKKPIDNWMAEAERGRKAKASLLGVTDKDVKKTKKAYENITERVKDMEANLVAVNVANPAMAKNFRKTLDKLKEEQKESHINMVGAQNDYEQEMSEIAGKLDSYDPNIQRLKDFDKYTAQASALEDEGIQGTRKKYRDLYNDTKKMQKIFNEGMNPEEIIENQKALTKLKDDLSEVEKVTRLAKQQTEAYASSFEVLGDTKDLEQQIKYQAELEEALEKRFELESKIFGLELQEGGKKAINDKIAANNAIIEQGQTMISQMEAQIEHEKTQIKNAREILTSSVRTNKEKIKARAQIEESELNIDGARTNIDNANESIVGAKEDNTEASEQLDVLKDLKEKASEGLLKKFPVLGNAVKIFKALKSLPGVLMRVLGAAGKYFLFISLAIVGALVIIKKILPAMKGVWSKIIEKIQPLLHFLGESLEIVYTGFMKVFNAFFGDGSISDAIDGLIEMAWGLLRVSLALTLTGLSIALMLLWELTKVLWDKTVNYIYGMLTDGKKFLERIGVVIAVIGVIISLILGAPLWLALVIGIALYKATDPVIKMMKWLGEKLNPKNWFGGGKATGGITDGRINLVGEKGPELVQLPKGSNVISNSQSRKMVNGKQNTVNNNHTHNYNITINAKDTSKAEMRRIADEIGKMVNNQIKRSVGR